MTGIGTRKRLKQAVVAVGCTLALAGATVPAAGATPTLVAGASAAAGKCGAPAIDAWYDRDQFGVYLKVSFKTAKGCPKGRRVGNLNGEVYCKTTGKRVYLDNARGKAPLESEIKTMPSKKKCKSFFAMATIYYPPSAKDFTDQWHWRWGDYPA
jgi:hypothetical protein